MEQSERINSEIGLQQKNTIIQAWTDFKDSIFNVLFVILDRKSSEEQEESLLGLIVESGLDYLLILAFPFKELVIEAWNGGQSLTHLVSFFKQFNIGSYVTNAPFSVFLVMLYTLIFIILLIIADIVYVSYSFSKKKFTFTFPLIVLAQIVPLFVTILFLPISEILLSVVECQVDAEGLKTMTNYPEVPCWQGWHLLHATITLLFLAIFVIISCVVALALFEPRMTTKKLTARQNSNAEVVFIVNKITLQFLFSFRPFQGYSFYVTLMFALSFWQFWFYSIKKPYYTKKAAKFFKMCSTYYFWTTLLLFVGLVFRESFDGAVVIWVSGLPFFALMIYFESNSDVNAIFSGNLKFKTGEQLDAHNSYVLQLVASQKEDKNSYMLLIGYIEKHKEICKETDCPLKIDHKKRAGENNMQHSCSLVLKQVERMFKSGIKKFPECTKLRLSYAFFQLEHLHNKEKAYEEFTNTSKLDPTFQQQFNIYRFKKIIRENLQNREKNDADLVETIRFENSVSLLEEAMLLSAKLHKEFWTELKEEVPDLKKLNMVGAQITEAGNAISENYSELTKINSTACEVLYSYAHYLMLISEDYNEGKELLANARKIYQDRQTGHHNDPKVSFQTDSLDKMSSPLLVVSKTSPNAMPRIVNVNLMFTQITGYQKGQLINQDISILAPHLFSRNGRCWLQLREAKREGEVFIKHKSDHLIAVDYSLGEPNQRNELHIVMKLAPANNMKMMLLATENGQITDCNLLAQTTFKQIITKMTNESKILNLNDIGISDFPNLLFRKQGASIIREIPGVNRDCTVQVESVVVQEYANAETDEEDDRMVVVSDLLIGYRVTIAKRDSNPMSDIYSESDQSADPQIESQLDTGVLQLYDKPNIETLMADISDKPDQIYQPFELRQAIKTMRLLNNEIKMVYQGNEADCNFAAGQQTGDDEREMFKFDDEGYQAKLRAAINTNLNHVEVANLRKVSILFLLLLFALNIIEIVLMSDQVNTVNRFLNEISLRASEYSLLTANVMAAIDPTSNYTLLFDDNQNHQVQFVTDMSVQIQLENNLTITRNLRDAVIMLSSRLLAYYQNPGSLSSISSIFMNYITNIYPAFLNYPTEASLNFSAIYVLTALVLLMAMLMMAYWMFINLKIDKKRYDIMIWFLDIPMPYVTHLGAHCDKYLKEFVTIKELTRKGIPLDEEEEYEEYSMKKNNNDESQIEEQIKARKSLISKNKKETLISKINLASFKATWMLAYSLIFSTILIVLSQRFASDYRFLLPQWVQTSQAVTIDNILYLTLQMQDYQIQNGTNLTALINKLRMDHKDVIINNNLVGFNYAILDFHLNDVASIYNTVYFNNLCLTLSLDPPDLAQCQTIVGSKLKSGYQVYSKYLITTGNSQNSQIRNASQYYTIPALVNMLALWEATVTEQGNYVVNACELTLYLFTILSALFFLLFWLYYLRRMNTELNQTIQMLNMIPFKLLPKTRKETKLFITWIIRESNKTKHEND